MLGASISRRGLGDCGRQGPRVVRWGLLSQGRVWALGVVVGLPGGDHMAGMSHVRNIVSLSSSSRIRPLKLSTKPFCIGFPGAM